MEAHPSISVVVSRIPLETITPRIIALPLPACWAASPQRPSDTLSPLPPAPELGTTRPGMPRGERRAMCEAGGERAPGAAELAGR